MLYLHPEKVNMKKARRDSRSKSQARYRKSDMMMSRPVYFVNEFNEISETGTVGFPDLATAEKGKRFINGIVDESYSISWTILRSGELTRSLT